MPYHCNNTGLLRLRSILKLCYAPIWSVVLLRQVYQTSGDGGNGNHSEDELV